MATEAREAAHGRKRRLQSLDRLDGSYPSEIAGTYHRQKIEAKIGRRGAVRERRRRVLLEIVRRQHIIGRCDEGLEEPPSPARDQPQGESLGRPTWKADLR